ncbi:hypothetical protein LDENG_00265060 [Lucifuga dentata]|nr:hypothetical protein LDENG_00265060 [Lucifuga dentata]
MGRRQAGGGSVMIWVTSCWVLGSYIHVDVTLTCSTYLNMAADQVQPFMAAVFPDGMASFSRIMHPATLQKMFRNGLRNMTKS